MGVVPFGLDVPKNPVFMCLSGLGRECEKKSVKNNPSMIEYK